MTRASLGVTEPSGLSVAAGSVICRVKKTTGSQTPGLVADRGSSAPTISIAQRMALRTGSCAACERACLTLAGSWRVQQYLAEDAKDIGEQRMDCGSSAKGCRRPAFGLRPWGGLPKEPSPDRLDCWDQLRTRRLPRPGRRSRPTR